MSAGHPADGMTERESILVIAPTPFFADRGCHVRIYEEVRLLQELGYRVEVCTYHHGRDVPGVRIHRSLNIPWYKKLDPGPSLHKLYADLFLLGTCLRVIRRSRPSLIHSHLHEGALLGGLLGRWFGIPSVADLQGSLTRELGDYGFASRNRLVYWTLQTLERWVDGLPDHLVVCSETMARDLEGRFGVSRERITVVRDGVGPSFFEEPTPDGRERYGIPAHHRVVVFMGVLTRLQGVEILMEAIQRVLEARDDVTFVVIGFPGEERLRESFRRRRDRERVVFTGRMDYLTVSRALAMADVALSPKISETEGNGKLFNYMACSLPTIVFDSPVNREILGDLGIYVATRTADAFARKVLEVLEGGDDVRDLGPRLRRRAIERASWDLNRGVIADVYGRIRRARPATDAVSGSRRS